MPCDDHADCLILKVGNFNLSSVLDWTTMDPYQKSSYLPLLVKVLELREARIVALVL